MRPDPDPPTLFLMNTVLTGSQLPQAADVVLRDGSTMRFQAPRADDRDRLLAFFRQLSDRSSTYASTAILRSERRWPSRFSTRIGVSAARSSARRKTGSSPLRTT